MSGRLRPQPGQRLRATFRYPDRGPMCPAVAWTYEGVVDRILDLEENAVANGLAPQTARSRFGGEFRIYLADAVATPDPQLPDLHPRTHERVVIVGDAAWEVVE